MSFLVFACFMPYCLPMNNDLIIAVQKRVDEGVPARSVAFDWQGRRYWIKIALKAQNNSWHKVQNFFATLLGNAMLRVTVSRPLNEGLQDEAQRLERVAKRGVLVPDVVAQAPGWLLLSDIGPCLFDQLQQVENKEPLLIKAAEAMAGLHNVGGWHGTGQLRDMISAPDGRIGFIDFEENVGEVMSPLEAQARDILRLLISAVRFDVGDGALLQAMLNAYHQKSTVDVWGHLSKTLALMTPLAFVLKPFQQKLGRDLRHALLVYSALKKRS